MRLLGADEEHLLDVTQAIREEILRIERLLSQFDAASELSRLNRHASGQQVIVDRELLEILWDCRCRCLQTEGYFDVTVGSPPGAGSFVEAVVIDRLARGVRFSHPATRLDLGGYGKGYALDAAGELLAEYHVDTALIHGGTSSMLLCGKPDGRPGWQVAIRDPRRGASPDAPLLRLWLSDCGVSTSATFAEDETETYSDLVDPHTRQPLREQASCTVIAPTAREAEVLSTALLVMGRPRAQGWLARQPWNSTQLLRVCWVSIEENQTHVQWLR